MKFRHKFIQYNNSRDRNNNKASFTAHAKYMLKIKRDYFFQTLGNFTYMELFSQAWNYFSHICRTIFLAMIKSKDTV